MKKYKSINIFFLILSLISLFLLSSCTYSEIEVNKGVTVDILQFCDATNEDFERYNNAFTSVNIELKKDNYRLMKVTCKISNENNFDISVQNVKSVENEYFYLMSNCIDLEPTFSISAHSSMDVDFYIYVNNNLKSDDEIMAKLNDLNIVLEAYKVRQYN